MYLVHRIPYPPNKGDKIRSFHILKYLSEKYQVNLGAFVDAEEDTSHRPMLQNYCEDLFLQRLRPWPAKIRSLLGFADGRALTLPYYFQHTMQQWVDKTIVDNDIKKVVVFSSAMAQYVSAKRHDHLKRIIDFVDMDSDKWRQYGESVGWPMCWIYRREGKKLLQYEHETCHNFDHSIFVSREEADHFIGTLPAEFGKISYINNGVDLDYFEPTRSYGNPYHEDETVIVFTGAMDYWANVNAVIWFVNEVFSVIKKAMARCSFYIVGSNPVQKVARLAETNGVYVTGRVSDIRPYLAHATISVAPLQIARGIQNKVLEAMAMRCTVFATPAAAEGLSAQHGKELLISENAQQMAKEIIEHLKSDRTGEIGANARAFVEREFRWEQNLSRLDALLDS